MHSPKLPDFSCLQFAQHARNKHNDWNPVYKISKTNQ
jgi:hypothetical protein